MSTDYSQLSIGELIDLLLDSQSDRERTIMFARLANYPTQEKQVWADRLLDQLPNEKLGWRRSITASTLAEMNLPTTADQLAKRLNPQIEKLDWVRFWNAIAVARMQPALLYEHYKRHDSKPGIDLEKDSPMVIAVVLRLLIENGSEENVTALSKWLSDEAELDKRMSACRALRAKYGSRRSLPLEIQSKFAELLARRLNDPNEWNDCQRLAASALGSMKDHNALPLRALRQAISDRALPPIVRDACIEAIKELNNPAAVDLLLRMLEDPDAGIRSHATEVIGRFLGKDQAIRALILQCIENHDDPPEAYLDAMRQISQTTTAEMLELMLKDTEGKKTTTDPVFQQSRLKKILTHLGGEEAQTALNQQRAKAVENYSDLLSKTTDSVMNQFDLTIARARLAFSLTMVMHAIIFALGIAILVVSLNVTFGQGVEVFQRFVGIGGAVGSLGTMLVLFYRNPLDNIRSSVKDLAQVNIVFLKYMRQIGEIDAIFKQLFVDESLKEPEHMQDMTKTVEQLNQVAQETLDQIDKYLMVGTTPK